MPEPPDRIAVPAAGHDAVEDLGEGVLPGGIVAEDGHLREGDVGQALVARTDVAQAMLRVLGAHVEREGQVGVVLEVAGTVDDVDGRGEGSGARAVVAVLGIVGTVRDVDGRREGAFLLAVVVVGRPRGQVRLFLSFGRPDHGLDLLL